MIKRITFLILLLATFSNSCKKVDDLTHFKMVFDEPMRDVMIIPLMVGNTVPLPFTTATDSESQFHKNKTEIDLVEQIILNKASLIIEDDFDVDFGFLESIKFYLIAEGRDDLLMASQTMISPDVGKTLVLDVIDQDLSFYLKKEEMDLKVEIKVRESVPDPFDIMIHMEYDVDSKVLGI